MATAPTLLSALRRGGSLGRQGQTGGWHPHLSLAYQRGLLWSLQSGWQQPPSSDPVCCHSLCLLLCWQKRSSRHRGSRHARYRDFVPRSSTAAGLAAVAGGAALLLPLAVQSEVNWRLAQTDGPWTHTVPSTSHSSALFGCFWGRSASQVCFGVRLSSLVPL